MENIHIASRASRSDRQSCATASSQRHRTRGRYCYEYLPFKLILLTNYWWGQMHRGPPNQNFGWAMVAHAAAPPWFIYYTPYVRKCKQSGDLSG